ncbi:hypothetical protein HYS91_02405 [Candidatus Daviesbacteria bacterium]|nr:hypothetical protein [Candidatus Daviesbacteria bacterium]
MRWGEGSLEGHQAGIQERFAARRFRLGGNVVIGLGGRRLLPNHSPAIHELREKIK